MRETGELSAGDLNGDRLYEKRGRAALPVLVRQACAGQTIYYGDLARELGMPNPRNLNYVLGAIGNSMLDLKKSWGKPVPPIQALVINQGTGLPGEGLSWFAPDAAGFKAAIPRERKRIVDLMLTEVFTFRSWGKVLAEYGLKPLLPPAADLPPPGEVSSCGGGGEGPEHLRLKEDLAGHPEWLELPRSLGPGQTEVPLYSGDRVDVVFTDSRRRIAVEVKPPGAPELDVIRGLFQCVKYLAVLEAEASAFQVDLSYRAILALGGVLPARLQTLRATLGIEVWERVGGGEL